ncbi:MAG: hypothetical protein GY832_10095 [Chloroflexi bacterium]|nr:hypothetical protein [Chloroflexota bacterium]
MSIAGRKGKFLLSQDSETAQDAAWERWEDVLTADVFGAYRYLPLKYGLIPFLTHARDETGRPLEEFLGAQGISLKGLTYARIHFWPHLTDGREPDLLILLGTAPDELEVALLVEAKLYAAQHQIEHEGITRSQIGHYMLYHLRGDYVSSIQPAELPPIRPILFVTLGRTLPKQELECARSEMLTANPELSTSELGIFWCSWATAGKEAHRLWKKHRHEVGEKPWLRHLLDLWYDINYRELVPRQPFQQIPQFVGRLPSWNFSSRTGPLVRPLEKSS